MPSGESDEFEQLRDAEELRAMAARQILYLRSIRNELLSE